MGDMVVANNSLSEERSVSEVVAQVTKIQDLMAKVMKKDEHFGIIPGTGKKSCLLKAGAEKLCFVFRLSPEFEITTDNLPNGHREYRVVCRLRNMTTGTLVGEGVGSCSTMESKYRYRNAGDYEVTDQPIPEDAKERKAEYRKQGYGMKQIDGVWSWVRYKSGEKVENADIADTYNTVLKMAKKRAHIDATITATAASDIFTQDVEELTEEEPHPVQPKKGKEPPAAKPDDPETRMKAAKALVKTYIASDFNGVPLFTSEEIDLARKKLVNLDMEGTAVLLNEANAAYLESVRDEYRKAMDQKTAIAKKMGGVPAPQKPEEKAPPADDPDLDGTADKAFEDDIPADSAPKPKQNKEEKGLF